MKPSKKVFEFYREANHFNLHGNINPDDLVNKTNVRIVEKYILKVSSKASKGAKPIHMIGKNGLANYLIMVGLLQKENRS